jgi:SH3-like domain-containing protein
MKVWGKMIVFLIIVVPIIVCFKVIEGIWNDVPSSELTEKDIPEQTQEEKDAEEEINNVITGTIGGSEYTAKQNPIGKIVEGGLINISVANVYKEADETSEVLGKLQKHTIIISQAFPDGWSIIKADNVTGWVKSDNIDLPEEVGDTSIGTAIGRTGVVSVDSLNVREKANSNAKKIETLTIDTEVKISGIEGEWYKIKWQNIEGWCASRYITLK